jgi:hypothetical protein
MTQKQIVPAAFCERAAYLDDLIYPAHLSPHWCAGLLA